MNRGENGGIITQEAAYPCRESLKVEPLWDTTCPGTTPTTPTVGCSYSYSECVNEGVPEATNPGAGYLLSLSRLLPEESGWEEAVGGDLAASPLGVVPESFPGNVGYFCSAGKELSYWNERCQINHQTSAQTSQEVCVCINPFFKSLSFSLSQRSFPDCFS